MSYLTISPELLGAAAGQLQGIGSTVSAANVAVGVPTTGVVPAAVDEAGAGYRLGNIVPVDHAAVSQH